MSDIELRLRKEINSRRYNAPKKLFLTRAEAQELGNEAIKKVRYCGDMPEKFEIRIVDEEGKINLVFMDNDIYLTEDKPKSDVDVIFECLKEEGLSPYEALTKYGPKYMPDNKPK